MNSAPTRILLRSAWQDVNIGDIGHTPGVLSLLDRYFPDAEITLWPKHMGACQFLQASHPRLKIVEGTINAHGKSDSPSLLQAFEETNLFLSNSGSGFPAHSDAAAFHRLTGKPFGFFAISCDPTCGFDEGCHPEGGTLEETRTRAMDLPQGHLKNDQRYVADHASFMFCRDSISRDYLRSQKAATPVLEFGPDAQLGMRLCNRERGDEYRKLHGLQEGKFICVIPRLRYTPYHHMRNFPCGPAERLKDEINERYCESDHAKIRDMIALYVRATGNKVLVCPEMTYQIELAKVAVVDPLPDDVTSKVVWRDTFWLPDEAAAIYAKAEAVVSLECHSPLIAYRNGTPAIYVRQPTDTSKGQMYRDFGAEDWLLEVDKTSGQQLWARLEAIHARPQEALAKVESMMDNVDLLHRRMIELVRTLS